jgi:hypothetical protein
MDSLLPAATAFDAASSVLSALLYLIVAAAALVRAPRDVRARVFLLVALASAAPYGISALIWWRGAGAALSGAVVAITSLSLMVGSLALLHFTQVFPWRRPWIRSHGRWLAAGYAAALVLVAASALITARVMAAIPPDTGTGGFGAVVSPDLGLAAIVIIIPALFLFGIVVPFAGLMSLFKSWQTAKAHGMRAARMTTMWMLVSQLAGGVLTILVIPLLHLAAPRGPWVTIAAALLFAFGLLMPIAFAVGIWGLGVLDLDIDADPSSAA